MGGCENAWVVVVVVVVGLRVVQGVGRVFVCGEGDKADMPWGGAGGVWQGRGTGLGAPHGSVRLSTARPGVVGLRGQGQSGNRGPVRAAQGRSGPLRTQVGFWMWAAG